MTKASDALAPFLAKADPLPAICVVDLVKRYGTVEAVRGLGFEIQQGEIFGLIGPDGAGKTSTFQILAGVMEATSGRADVYGQPARAARATGAARGRVTGGCRCVLVARRLEWIRDRSEPHGVGPRALVDQPAHLVLFPVRTAIDQ